VVGRFEIGLKERKWDSLSDTALLMFTDVKVPKRKCRIG
jgi:hypothetical protein